MSKLKEVLKHHIIWAGFLAVLVPLLVLLALQYGWLISLEKTTVLAHQATLNNYLEAVASEVQYFYQGTAERVLNLPSVLFTQNRLDNVAYHFEKKGAQGARYLFVLSFYGDDRGKLLFFDPAVPSMELPADSDAVRAVYVACAPWSVLSKKEEVLDAAAVTVDERDPDNRIIMNPITDESSHLVGVAGMIVDMRFFKQVLLPKVIKKSLPAYFTYKDWKKVAVTVRDSRGDLKFATDDCAAGNEEARRAFSFIFTDWKLGLRSGRLNPKEWAEASFALNMGLSVLIAVVLLSGTALALRTASREMKLSQMKSDFVSNVSHELRTPLASIRVFGEFLKLGRANSTEKVREYGEYIETESRRLTRLINNILDFSKIESGRKTYQFQPADVKQVLADTLRTFEVRLRHSGFVINFECPPEPIPPVLLDADAIGQAFNNLLDNAVKYSNGAKEISVRVSREDGWVVIAVKDSGIGISRNEQEKIFERFHRVSTGLVHDVKGSGLGLSIVNHIVKAHRGKVGVESEPGEGSTFFIRLPLGPQGDETPAPQGQHRQGPLAAEDSHA